MLMSIFGQYYQKKLLILPIKPDPEARHIFWTGGYDSTFRLCQALICEKKKVQPIYLQIWNMDSENGIQAKRKNLEQELRSQELIRANLIKKFPEVQREGRLLPTLIVTHIPSNKALTDAYVRLHEELGYFGRRITQYERMARFSWFYPYSIDVGLEKCGTGLDRATQFNRVGHGDECQLKTDLAKKYRDLQVFRHFRYPIVHLTKHQMLDIARAWEFEDIVSQSWSCWYPKNGRPCGRCEMCKHRII